MTIDSEERKMDKGKGKSYTHHLIAGYTQSVNEVRMEIIQQ